ncbi:hypothetical protein, partial [Streptomyces sp. NPDC000618]|uniref:hypothetical protein n=1 Tax=Streptomyces sp. NPDC000618 TaxID=3154265 RepID=UPI0033275B16
MRGILQFALARIASLLEFRSRNSIPALAREFFGNSIPFTELNSLCRDLSRHTPLRGRTSDFRFWKAGDADGGVLTGGAGASTAG